MSHAEPGGLTIGDVVERTGVAEATLRMWERRHGFPAPERLPSGHRRYSERDIELIKRVAVDRGAGMSVAAAIDQAHRHPARETTSLFAAMRSSHPDVSTATISKARLIALTRAIEDESLSRAERPILFGSFQRERFYRQSEARWRELARTARLAVVFADFGRRRTPRNAPAEMPVKRDDPLTREWAVVCDADGHAACLAAWERPTPGAGTARTFETFLSVEPEIVREASRICAAIAGAVAPGLVAPARAQLEARPFPTSDTQLRLAAAIIARTLAYLS
jgi:MerR family transcriptional regulator, light-induced transcriptional regulator